MHQVIPRRLYSAPDLLDGFNPFDDLGFTLTRDFETYRQFAVDGGPVPKSLDVRIAQADHDSAIAEALKRFLGNVDRPLLGFMGGHAAKRNGKAFAAEAASARLDPRIHLLARLFRRRWIAGSSPAMTRQ